jgi:hypothetical protein
MFYTTPFGIGRIDPFRLDSQSVEAKLHLKLADVLIQRCSHSNQSVSRWKFVSETNADLVPDTILMM